MSDFVFATIFMVISFVFLCVGYILNEKAKKIMERALALQKKSEILIMGVAESYSVNGTNGFIDAIRLANPGRSFSTMPRRLLKLSEETGEASEAFLVATTTSPTRKTKTYDDFREELIDVGLVNMDCALTKMPGEENLTDDEITAKIMALLAFKIEKWKSGKSDTSKTKGG
jgi:NTP pyrophosphatase (non-canonical NTP hydrolase)